MKELTKEEQSILKMIILRHCVNRIKDIDFLLKIETIYEKLFDADIKKDFNEWKQFNQSFLNGN
jgi:hypothetical protein